MESTHDFAKQRHFSNSAKNHLVSEPYINHNDYEETEYNLKETSVSYQNTTTIESNKSINGHQASTFMIHPSQ